MNGERIHINGAVQGVGFRPFVWRLANSLGIRGSVKNNSEGVVIEAWASAATLADFRRVLRTHPPPLARVESFHFSPLKNEPQPTGFEILDSTSSVMSTLVADDAKLCEACRKEIFDPDNRRYRYPFTNCTECGPRLSILRNIPYDRANTTMVDFAMCDACAQEYHDPSSRRFHAQPNACPECGPRVWLEKNNREISTSGDDVLVTAADLIRSGSILAIKSLGGFRLACDATNAAVIERLRQNKHRPRKPLALMAGDMAIIRDYVHVNKQEQQALEETANSIVLLHKRGHCSLPENLAPGLNHLGFMLPGTALEYLLLKTLPFPIVMTSGNISDSPPCIDNDEARQKLSGIADYFVMNNRRIEHRLDDSLLTVRHKRQVLRRSRGLCCRTYPLPAKQTILALGAESKNTFCLVHHGKAYISPHLGDLQETQNWLDFQKQIHHYLRLHQCSPHLIVVDRHPAYLSSRFGRDLAKELKVPLLEVQHHHAHVAAVMAEHQLPDHENVLGIALDGLGIGFDNALWGGEFILANYHSFTRVACFKPVPLPGGDKAALQPWRNLLAHLLMAGVWSEISSCFAELPAVKKMQANPQLASLQRAIGKNINSPPASSCGRLFDAVAAALDICHEQVYFEGQAAMEMEALAQPYLPRCHDIYHIDWRKEIRPMQLEWKNFWCELFADLKAGTRQGLVAAKFHNTLIQTLGKTAIELCVRHALSRVVLAGGVWQNRLLAGGVARMLREAGCMVYEACSIPPNDGGIAFGQAAIASSTI